MHASRSTGSSVMGIHALPVAALMRLRRSKSSHLLGKTEGNNSPTPGTRSGAQTPKKRQKRSRSLTAFLKKSESKAEKESDEEEDELEAVAQGEASGVLILGTTAYASSPGAASSGKEALANQAKMVASPSAVASALPPSGSTDSKPSHLEQEAFAATDETGPFIDRSPWGQDGDAFPTPSAPTAGSGKPKNSFREGRWGPALTGTAGLSAIEAQLAATAPWMATTGTSSGSASGCQVVTPVTPSFASRAGTQGRRRSYSKREQVAFPFDYEEAGLRKLCKQVDEDMAAELRKVLQKLVLIFRHADGDGDERVNRSELMDLFKPLGTEAEEALTARLAHLQRREDPLFSDAAIGFRNSDVEKMPSKTSAGLELLIQPDLQREGSSTVHPQGTSLAKHQGGATVSGLDETFLSGFGSSSVASRLGPISTEAHQPRKPRLPPSFAAVANVVIRKAASVLQDSNSKVEQKQHPLSVVAGRAQNTLPSAPNAQRTSPKATPSVPLGMKVAAKAVASLSLKQAGKPEGPMGITPQWPSVALPPDIGSGGNFDGSSKQTTKSG
eukprot:CAMPEP_0178390506 /NCGR_PEP_ID=MMETSP0689_2-20121128/10682_1 /TAXON_ID=160604 /ORGANISM="Amphidinium massartii, Strain CS-259" /LENGTH=556 /DNA_ID=CAMNT_0020011019 /DNA_START=54 /DNA_END=1720 /DNA_ORIENTATION=+